MHRATAVVLAALAATSGALALGAPAPGGVAEDPAGDANAAAARTDAATPAPRSVAARAGRSGGANATGGTNATGNAAAQAGYRAVPPRPAAEDHGLGENVTAVLWSRDDDRFVNDSVYRSRYGEDRTALAGLANGTDIPLERPPSAAATWSDRDFDELSPGGDDTSVHPPGADLAEGERHSLAGGRGPDGRKIVFLEDVHATLFGVHPATVAHVAAGDVRRYVDTEGTVRGLVDWRTRTPDDRVVYDYPDAPPNYRQVVNWSITESRVRDVKLIRRRGGVRQSARAFPGTKRPEVDFSGYPAGRSTVVLQANVTATLERNRTTYFDRPGDGRDPVLVSWSASRETQNVTVTDALAVTVYDPSVDRARVRYPSGETGLLLNGTTPWRGATLNASTGASVSGRWEFFTARNTTWDRLVRSTESGDTTVTSDSLPVVVHAYPERGNVTLDGTGDEPAELVAVRGRRLASPNATIGPNVSVPVVTGQYTPSDRVAVRGEDVDPAATTVHGLVRGTTVDVGRDVVRTVNRTNLTATVVSGNESYTTVRVVLRDNATGAPIDLSAPVSDPLVGPATGARGYVGVAGERTRTNASGVAVVTVQATGTLPVRYHPVPWVRTDPAYVPATTTVSQYDRVTVQDVFDTLVSLSFLVLPFVVALYAGKQVATILRTDRRRR